MSHNNNILSALDDFMQRVRLDSCLYTGVSFHLLCFTAKVSNVFTVFYNDLVAAAGKSQINGAAGVFLAFAECVGLKNP